MAIESSDGLLEPIAVIGLAFQFPGGADTEDKFWDLLTERQCTSGEFPRDRCNIDMYHNPKQACTSKAALRNGHFLANDIREFDPRFFSISQAEAGAMDPQHRALMETTYHALENAGLTMKDMAGSRTSVHVGSFASDHQSIQSRDSDNIAKYSATGTSKSILSNRISWFFDLLGPSITIDTACSSSMVALDLACKGLWSGHVETAIVGGANLIQSPELSIMLSNMSFLSPEGRCYSFDHRANGYARGEGVAALILKPLSSAIRDRNPLRALVRAIGTNQDGYTKGGLTQPSMKMQAALINETYRKANLTMAETRFFEAHGTGTRVGDPIEARAIGECFRLHRSPEDPIYVGALKSNVGHLEGCSGLAGVIKAILTIEKGIIPPNANFEKANPEIDAEFFNLDFPTRQIPWPSNGSNMRRASVNSFGFGGTNAHVILDDADSYLKQCIPASNGIHKGLTHFPETKGHTQIDSDTPALLLLSSADEGGCGRVAEALSADLSAASWGNNDITLDDIAYTLNMRRTKLQWKSFILVQSLEDIENSKHSMSTPVKKDDIIPKMAFVFTGQGAQWLGMGKELLDWSVFFESVLESQACIMKLNCPWSLIDLLSAEDESFPIESPKFSQLLTTVVQIGLVDLYASIQIWPTVVVGHSSGEIAAAYSAGLIDRFSAIKLSYFRGELAAKLVEKNGERHSMLAVGLSPAEFETQLQELRNIKGQNVCNRCTISCINAPANITVSAPQAELDILSAHFSERGAFVRQLNVGVGYHSSQMCDISSEYISSIGTLTSGGAGRNIRMVSSVTGQFLDSKTATSPIYWNENMVSQVQFLRAGILCFGQMSQEETQMKLDQSHLDETSISGILEIGPHSTLKAPIRQILHGQGRTTEVFYASALVRGKSSKETVLSSCGQLYCNNVPVDIGTLTSWCQKAPTKPKMVSQLPKYPFDHSTLYWEENRLNRELRRQKHMLNQFLGVRIGGGALPDARWRLILRADEQPWIKDHVINGANIYPGSGMVVMALEAAKQLLSDRPPTAFILENVQFIAPILLNDSSTGTEVEICLLPTQIDKEETHYEFRIGAWRQDESKEKVCQGYIYAVYGNGQSALDSSADSSSNSDIWTQVQEAELSCSMTLDDFYGILRAKCRADYGSSFQRLRNVSLNNGGEMLAQLTPYGEDCIVHPAVLDAAFQVVNALPAGSSTRTLAPRRIGRLWISASGIGHSSSSNELVYARTSMLSRRTAVSALSVLRPMSRQIGLAADDFEYTAIGEDSGAYMSERESKHLVVHMIWKPDPELLTIEQSVRFCNQHRDCRDDPIEYFHDWRAACIALGSRVLSALPSSQELTPEFRSYSSWLTEAINCARRGCVPNELNALETYITENDALDNLCNRLIKKKNGKVYVEVGKHLEKILSGKLDPLAVIFADEQLMRDYYDEMLNETRPLRSMQAYLDIIAHKNPDMNLLEIGAGTGGSTSTILEVLDDWAGHRYGQYVFTDIGPSFLEKARERFKDRENMKFRPLDIEEDPLKQGFAEHEFDIIIADMVLHATSDLTKTLQNVRVLLKPGGKLILKEIVNKSSILTGFVFGLLPGWWLSVENSRTEARSPCIDEKEWDNLLKSNHFSGTDLVMRDFDTDDCHLWSYLISTADDAGCLDYENSDLTTAPVIITRDHSNFQEKLAQIIHNTLKITGKHARTMSLEEVANLANLCDTNLIVLLEIENPILVDVGADSFTDLQKMLGSAKSVLWVSQNSYTDSPDHGIITGLSRVLRTENNATHITTLGVETRQPDQIATHVSNVYNATQAHILVCRDPEPEYLEQSEVLHINRLVSSKDINDHICKRTTRSIVHEAVGNKNIRLGIQSLGLLDTLEFSEEIQEYQDLAPDEVIVRVQAIGVNFKDCLTLLGRIDTDSLGSECAGVIVQTGNACGNLVPGARVVVCTFDAYRSFVRTNVNYIFMIPEWMSFVEAASIPTAFFTAHFSLLHVARLQENEKVLIHAASGGTGQAAIQVVQSVGAEVYATVGSLAKKQLLMDVYKIPESNIFYSRDTSFAERIKEKTCGEGMDVILNSLAGKQLQASWESIANFGRFVEIGRSDIDSRRMLPMYPFRKNASFTGVDLELLLGKKGGSVVRKKPGSTIPQEVMNLVKMGTYKPVHPIHEYAAGNTEDALRFIQSGKSSGKIVINMSEDAVVPILQGPYSAYKFRPDATYLICGGLGGLGRTIAKWLTERGAKNLILLSRSGNCNVKTQEYIQQLRTKGINVECPACDISKIESLNRALEECSHLPPIKGCFQGAMVLRDSTFARMTYDQWKESTLPKIQGSWNLHTAMAGMKLDFFILLSSAGAIFGNGGQGNYAAGNTFQDALARYRVLRGDEAISINLGMILGEGYVAENEAIRERLLRKGTLAPIMIAQLLALLDYCCNPTRGKLAPDECQLVTGLMLPRELRAKGREVPFQLLQPMFRCVAQIPSCEGMQSDNNSSINNLITAFQEADNVTRAATQATALLRDKTSRLLGVNVQEINENSQLKNYGVDSLVAIEMRNWISRDLKIDVAVFEILGGMSLLELGTLIAQRKVQ